MSKLGVQHCVITTYKCLENVKTLNISYLYNTYLAFPENII